MCLILVGLTELRRRLIWLVGATCTGGWAHGARHGTGTYGDREGVVYLGEYQPGGTASRAHPFGPRARALRAREIDSRRTTRTPRPLSVRGMT